jgi:hypothetical protein
MKLSIVLANKAILASTVTNKDDSGASVDNGNSTDVTHTAVNTDASDGDKVFKADFGVKSAYQLYNYTADSSENTASAKNVNVRTVNLNAWGGNPVFYTPASNVGLLTAIFLAVAVAAGVGGLFAFLFRKRRAAGIAVSGVGPTGPSPTQDPTPSGPTIPGR